MTPNELIAAASEAGDWDGQIAKFDDVGLAVLASAVEDDFKERLAQAIQEMPFGDTASSFANYVRNFK